MMVFHTNSGSPVMFFGLVSPHECCIVLIFPKNQSYVRQIGYQTGVSPCRVYGKFMVYMSLLNGVIQTRDVYWFVNKPT